MKSNGKQREWRKALFAVLRPGIRLVARLFFGATTKVYRHIDGPYLVLANHSYIADALLMGAAFLEPLHIVSASATLESSPSGRLVRFLADPIPVDKTGRDIKGIKRMLAEAKMGHSIGLFPEGNISIDGSPLPIDRSVAKLAKQLKLKIVLYRIEGGYLKKPKWALRPRRGRVVGRVVDVISPEEAAEMDVDTLHARILAGISYDAFAADRVTFDGKGLAEGIERLLYMCPACGRVVRFESKGDSFRCAACDTVYHIDAEGRIDCNLANTAVWNEWQTHLALEFADPTVYAVEGNLCEVATGNVAESGKLTPTPQGLAIGRMVVPYAQIDGVVLHDCNNVLLTMEGVEYRFVPADTHANVLPIVAVVKNKIE